MAWPKAVIYGATVGVTAIVTVGTIIGGIAATKVLLVGGVEQQITRLENNIPSKVKEGVRDALAEDKVVRIQVNAIVDDQLKELIRDNNVVLTEIKAELTKNRENLTTAIREQTEQFSRDIDRLEDEMSGVRAMQNIMMLRLLKSVPDDPEDYFKKGIWNDPFFNVAPVWVIERKDYDLLDALMGGDADKKVLYRMEAVKGSPD